MKNRLMGWACVVFVAVQAGCSQLPRQRIEVHVVDEEGVPLPGATVVLGFDVPASSNPWDGAKTTGVRGLADEDGVFMGSARSLGRSSVWVQKEGFYDSRIDHEDYSDSPGLFKVKLTLRRIVDPVPMYARRVHLELPVAGEAVGYDLMKGDWLPPHGEGKVADLFVLIEREFKNVNDFTSSLTITAAGQGTGLRPIKGAELYGDSEFPYPRQAPDSGYQKSLTMKWIRRPDGNHTKSMGADTGAYFIRVTRRDEQGNRAPGFLYGRIVQLNEYWIYNTDTAELRFIYYITPDGSRNTEWDEDNNLFGNLHHTERVR